MVNRFVTTALRRIALALAALAFGMAIGPARASVGFQQLSIPDGTDPPLDIGIWYPSDAPATPHRLGLGEQVVAADAPLAGTALPLVLLSHGSGGWLASNADTGLALAAAGFVVAAVTHTGDNFRDQSRVLRILGRPEHVVRLLDYMLAGWPDHARIDPHRIGMFGHSAGGFTALVLAGGVPDLTLTTPHCAAHPDEWTCKLLARHADAPATDIAPPHDARIRAIAVAAPALGYTFGTAGLAGIRIPVQVWRAEHDEILPYPFYAEAVAAALPAPPDYRVVANAGHFAFLAPCGASLAALYPDICKDAPGFDRAAFHATFNAALAAFFTRTLPP